MFELNELLMMEQPSQQPAGMKRVNPLQKTILIVEDETDVCKLLSMRLEHLGYNCIVATDGVEGLELARDRHPDLILLDLNLPKMPGEAVCTSIKDSYDEALARIPIIMITAKTTDTDRVVGKAVGADAFITKPFEFEEVWTEVSRLLGE